MKLRQIKAFKYLNTRVLTDQDTRKNIKPKKNQEALDLNQSKILYPLSERTKHCSLIHGRQKTETRTITRTITGFRVTILEGNVKDLTKGYVKLQNDARRKKIVQKLYHKKVNG